MSARHWVWGLLACSACTLDLVDVGDAAQEHTTMRLFIVMAGSLPDASLNVSAQLTPGKSEDAGQRRVTGAGLEVMGVPLAADSTVEDARLVLTWNTSISLPDPDPDFLTVGLPDVEGVPTPGISPIQRDRAQGWVGAPAAWEPASNLRLLHSTVAEADGAGANDDWAIEMFAIDQGHAEPVFATFFEIPLPDTIEVPAAWLAGVEGDSLRVTMTRDRSLNRPASPGGYEVVGEVRQHLHWIIPIGSLP